MNNKTEKFALYYDVLYIYIFKMDMSGVEKWTWLIN